MNKIIHASTDDLTMNAHTIKSLLNIKFSRAKEIHAKAMGFKSSSHLLIEIKIAQVEQDFRPYIDLLKQEALNKHQIKIDNDLVERLRYELLE